jgi:hypothetical protein
LKKMKCPLLFKDPSSEWLIDIEKFSEIAQARLIKYGAEQAKGIGIGAYDKPVSPSDGWFTKEEACAATNVTSAWFDYVHDILFHKWSVAFGTKTSDSPDDSQPERYLIKGDAFMRLVELSALHRAQVQTRWGVVGVIVGACALVVQTVIEILKWNQ